MSEVRCVNCGNSISGKLCDNCGQPAHPNPLTWRTAWEDFIERLYSLDSKFLRTVFELTTHPGTVAKRFVAGNRVRYMPPISYFLITITLVIIFMQLLGVSFADTISQTQEQMNPEGITEQGLKFQQLVNEKMSEYMRTLNFLQIPFVALACMWFFRKDGFTFLEHGVLAFYTHGHLGLLGLPNALLTKAEINIMTMILPFVTLLYFGFACTTFYSNKPVSAFIKGVIAHMLGFILFTVFLMVIMVVGVLIYVKFFNPDYFQQ